MKTTTKLQGNAKDVNKTDMSIDKNGLLRFKDELNVPNSIDLKWTILDELHKKSHSGHPGY
jgi:hypothetical protein